MFVTGPNVVKTVTHEDVTMEQLGGADTHAGSPASRISCTTPSRRRSRPFAICSATSRRTTRRSAARTRDDPRDRRDEALLDVVPDHPNKPYDMHDVIRRVVDDGEFYEVQGDTPATSLRLRAHRRVRASASLPISPACSPVCSTSRRRSRPRGSFASATRSTSRS
jgi:propionyl-CoA carboxylase beta chain